VRAFFGLLHDFDMYHVDSAGIVLYPNFTVVNDPHIPKRATPGANWYLPIPFSKSCRISLRSPKEQLVVSMVDWHEYPEDVNLASFRFHAQHNVERPAKHRGVFPMLEDEGRGFVAGYFMGCDSASRVRQLGDRLAERREARHIRARQGAGDSSNPHRASIR
jgi:hypothetical protein